MITRVLHLLGSGAPENRAQVEIVRALAKGLDPHRFQTEAMFLGGGHDLRASLERDGIRTESCDWDGSAREPGGMIRFVRHLLRHRLDIVHQHHGGRLVRMLIRMACRAPIVLHLHGRLRNETSPDIIRPETRWAHAIIATSAAVAHSTTRRGSIPLHVVYPGVHLRHTEPRACIAGPTIGTACRLVPIKGVDVLIRAFADLSAEFPGLHLEIAGDGPERERLEKCAAETRVGPRIRFLGWRGNLVEDLRRWRLFVMPSLEEAFGVAALEAMAVGLPLVGTRVGGLPELIEDGRTGLLVPPGDPEALGRAIRSLLLRPGLMLSMGTAGREKAVGEFSIDRMLSATREAYAQALALR